MGNSLTRGWSVIGVVTWQYVGKQSYTKRGFDAMIARCVACAALARIRSLSMRPSHLAVLHHKIERCQICPGEYVLSLEPTLESAWQRRLLSRRSGRLFTCYVAMKNSARLLSLRCSGSAGTTESHSTSLTYLSWLLLSASLPSGLQAAFLSTASHVCPRCTAACRDATRFFLRINSPGE